MSRPLVTRIALALLLGVGIALAVAYRDQVSPQNLEALVAGLGVWAPLAYIAIWLVAPVLFLPGTPITLAGGALFGVLWGTVYTLIGATSGATLAFMVARYLAGDWVERKAHGQIGRIKSGVEAEGWRFVAFVRLVPLFPFNLLNYALGLTRIPLRTYVLTSLVCMAPGSAGYAYLGAFGRDALLGGENLVQKGLIAVGVFAALVFLPFFVRRFWGRRELTPGALHQRLQDDPELVVLDVRSGEEYARGHIAGSRLIPVDELPQRLDELQGERGKPLAVVCRTERRSRRAVQVLNGAGFDRVYLVTEGLESWAAQGLPLEQGAAAPAPPR